MNETTENSIQNVSSVSSFLDEGELKTVRGLDQEILKLETAKPFLLNKRLFGSYVPTNNNLIVYLETYEKPFTLQSLIDYIEDAVLSAERARTVNRKKCAVKRIVAELINLNPEKWTRLDQFFIDRLFRSIKIKTVQNRRIPEEQYLLPDQIEKLTKAADQKTRAIILFLTTTGCRVSELASCRIKDIERFETSADVLLSGKGNKERHVRISRNLLDRIERLYHGHEYLFCTKNKNQLDRKFVYKKIQSLGLKVLDKKIGPHIFRHSFAMMMLQSGKDLKAVSNYLGHSGTEVTADMYVHTTVSFEEIPDFEQRVSDWEVENE